MISGSKELRHSTKPTPSKPKKSRPTKKTTTTKTKVNKTLFQPISEAQAIAIDTRADETLFFGNRGAGKTAAQLLCFRKLVNEGYGSSLHGLILDTEYKALQDIVRQSRQFYGELGDGAKFSKTLEGFKWTWPGGEELRFDHMKRLEDYHKIHGHSYQFVGFNELTKFPSPDIYEMVMSTVRSGHGVPCKVFSTTNPYGQGHSWVKKRFIDVAPVNSLLEKEIKLPNGQVVTRTQIAIEGDHNDNPYMTDQDIATLIDSVKHDKKRYKAWVESSWDIAVGGAFSDIWDKDLHCVPRFNIPRQWRIDRCMDWGSTDPYAIIWFAESNGEEVEIANQKRTFPRGSLIAFMEIYGHNPDLTHPSNGSRRTATYVAKQILAKERAMIDSGLISTTPQAGAADGIYSQTRINVETTAREMERHGVTWFPAHKPQGSRTLSKQLLRERIAAATSSEGRGLWFTFDCPHTINQIPRLEEDGEDIKQRQEDHLYDVCRYKLLHRANLAARLRARFKF